MPDETDALPKQDIQDMISTAGHMVVLTPADQITLESNLSRFNTWIKHSFSSGMEARKIHTRFIIRNAVEKTFEFLSRPRRRSDSDILAGKTALDPWAYSLTLAEGIDTKIANEENDGEKRFHAYRVSLIVDTIIDAFSKQIPTFTMLDIACHCGVFSLEFAARGVRHVTGIDIRQKNIDQANFLKDLYGVTNCDFSVGDAEHLPDKKFDIILNFGILYHTIFPLQMLQYCYDHCNVATIIDTNVYNSPFSAFYFVANKDTASTIEGKLPMELMPTYEALILALQAVGFTNIVEITGADSSGIPLFASGHRRCVIAFKKANF